MEPPIRCLSREEADRLADEIAELSAQIDAACHRLLTLIRRFDASSGWGTQGALTCSHWLSWRIGLDLGAAREQVRVARALGGLPAIDEALRRGQVSYSKVRALTRVAKPENEATLLHWARSCTASQLEGICRKYRSMKRREVRSLEDEAEIRFVRVRDTDSGMVRIEAQLPPEEAAVVLKALEVAARRDERGEGTPAETPTSRDRGAETPAETRSWDRGEGSTVPEHAPSEGPSHGSEASEALHRPSSRSNEIPAETRRPPNTPKARLGRADALVAVAEAYLTNQLDAQRRTPPVEVVVHVEQRAGEGGFADGASLDDGTPLSADTAARLACDANVVRVVEDEHGTPLDVGRRTRTIPAALKRALRLRDRACRYPSCTNRIADGHHIVAWSKGGPTRLGNLVLLCRRHHGFVHERGYRIERVAENELLFLDPRGSVVPRVPASPALESDGPALLRTANAEEGIEIDARTSLPSWDGRRVDYDLVLHVLYGMDHREAAAGVHE